MSYDPSDNVRDDEPQDAGQELPTVPLEVLLTPTDKQWLASIHVDGGHTNWFRANP
jgi:hypothetical protein